MNLILKEFKSLVTVKAVHFYARTKIENFQTLNLDNRLTENMDTERVY